jgi:hypothetical protein
MRFPPHAYMALILPTRIRSPTQSLRHNLSAGLRVLGLAVIGLFALSLTMARVAHLATDRALALFAYAPRHRAHTVTRLVTFTVLFTTMYAGLLYGIAVLVAQLGTPTVPLHVSSCPSDALPDAADCIDTAHRAER